MKAKNIQWDTNDASNLPTEVEIPDWLHEVDTFQGFKEEVKVWLRDEYGYVVKEFEASFS